VNSSLAAIFAVNTDDGFSAPIEDEGGPDEIQDNDEDLMDPMNLCHPRPKGNLPRVPAGKFFRTREEKIEEMARRVANYQEPCSPEDRMPEDFSFAEITVNKKPRGRKHK
jgi:hypothetical protein